MENTTEADVGGSVSAIIGGSAYLATIVPGLTTYTLVILGILLEPDLIAVPYYKLVVSLGISDCIGLVVFITYSIPCVFTNQLLGGTQVDTFVGAILNVGWFSSIPAILFLAINRFARINWPRVYMKLFTKKGTSIMICMIWLAGFLLSLPTIISAVKMERECAITFESLAYWFWAIEYECANTLLTIEYYFVWTVCIVSLVLYMLMFIKVHFQRQKINAAVRTRDEVTKELEMKQEIKLFIQCFLVTVYLLLLNIMFMNIASITNPFASLYGSSIAYAFNNSINAYIYIALNPFVRTAILRLFRSEHEVKEVQSTAADLYEDTKVPDPEDQPVLRSVPADARVLEIVE